jgi:hypothetical protein
MSISLQIINNRTSMSKDEMINKIFDSIVDQMGTLINDDDQRMYPNQV